MALEAGCPHVGVEMNLAAAMARLGDTEGSLDAYRAAAARRCPSADEEGV